METRIFLLERSLVAEAKVSLEVSMNKGRLPPQNDNQISNKKDNVAESKSYRRRYSDHFEFAPVGYFTFDRSGVVIDVNPKGALLLGTDRSS